MPRPPRPLTPAEESGSCPLCGARPGERCTNPSGSTYAPGEHISRRPGQRPQRQHDPDETYTVIGCRHCAHPGGAHVIDQWEPRLTHCRLCRGCPGYEDGPQVQWSERMTWAAEARVAQGNADG